MVTGGGVVAPPVSDVGLPGTAFTRLVGCALPIQQAPIGYPAADPTLAAAVAAAGGHGMLAAVRMAAGELSEALDVLNSQTRAYGVNLIQAILDRDAFEVAADKAPLVELYIGEPDPELVNRIHSDGALPCRQVISADEARAAQEEGCYPAIPPRRRESSAYGSLALLLGRVYRIGGGGRRPSVRCIRNPFAPRPATAGVFAQSGALCLSCWGFVSGSSSSRTWWPSWRVPRSGRWP